MKVLFNFLRKILLQRHLIWNFVVRDLKSRYVGSVMGLLWSVIHPLVLLVSYTFVFSVIFKIRPGVASTDNFALFLFCGLLPWLYFQDTVLRGCTSVVDNGHLIRKTLFPSEILPLTVALSNLTAHLIGFTVLAVVLLYLGLGGWAMLWILLYWVLLVVLSLGLGWLAAVLQVFLRDTVQVLSVLLIFWFWFTPIFYAADNPNIPQVFRTWLRVNPLSHVVEGYRIVLLENRAPDPLSVGILTLWSVVAFSAGGALFRSCKREFIDVL